MRKFKSFLLFVFPILLLLAVSAIGKSLKEERNYKKPEGDKVLRIDETNKANIYLTNFKVR